MNDEGTVEMTEEECWDELSAQEFGRLAHLLGDELHLVPVNYAVDGRTLLFRTAEGSKLLGIVLNPKVVLEIDRFEEHRAMSVEVRGNARLLEEDEEHRAEHVPLRPWVGHPKYNVVEVAPTHVTGRRFDLHRPRVRSQPAD
jgi:nitroimidazol reductase NimA-like FMN-containing flavoprotein (pyridoxamine 5'-phosphate oxidase superfamily)